MILLTEMSSGRCLIPRACSSAKTRGVIRIGRRWRSERAGTRSLVPPKLLCCLLASTGPDGTLIVLSRFLMTHLSE